MMENEDDKPIETAAEIYESEIDYSERKPRSRERGPDRKPRTYRANSMKNFVQFREKPEVFAKYLNDEKGVDIAGNSGIAKAFLIFVGVMIAVLGGLWLYNRYKNERKDGIENMY